MPSFKTLLVVSAAAYAGFSGISHMLDQLGPATPEASLTTTSDDAQNLAKLLAGADPTDLFEPSAAGQPASSAPCFTGRLEIDSTAHAHLAGASFISQSVDKKVFITVLTLPPVHLYQNEHQAVTATHLATLPEAILPQMQQTLARRSHCQQRSLYLSRIE